MTNRVQIQEDPMKRLCPYLTINSTWNTSEHRTIIITTISPFVNPTDGGVQWLHAQQISGVVLAGNDVCIICGIR